MEHLITFAITMLTVTNPAGNLAIFAGLTANRTEAEKQALARQTAIAITVIMLVVTWVGSLLLKAFGVTPPGLEVAGGVIIALLGLSMLRSKTDAMTHSPEEHEEAQTKDSIAVVPMAIPIIAGPGAITTLILATQKFPSFEDRFIISLVAVGIGLLFWLVLYFAGPISRKLGVTGMNIVSKIMGMVLTAIAFQMLANGLKELLPGLA